MKLAWVGRGKWVHALYALVLVVAGAALYLQYRTERELKIEIMTERTHEAFEQINGTVTLALDQVNGMQIVAEQFFALHGSSPDRQAFLVGKALRRSEHFDGFALDRLPPPLAAEVVGNLTGAGSPEALGGERLHEIEFAFVLNAHFHEAQKVLPHLARIYYISRREFTNSWPWVPSSVSHWTPEILERDAYRLGLPENNEARLPFWTGPFLHPNAGKLMVTLGLPMYRERSFLGTVAIDLGLDALSDFVHGKRAPFTTALVVNDAGQVIGHPLIIDRSEPAPLTLEEVLPSALAPHVDAIHGESKARFVEMGDYLVFNRRISNAPWSYVVHAESRAILVDAITDMVPEGIVFALLVVALMAIERARLTSIQLSQARAAADEANRAKSSFLANMSHEIRTPMSGIVGMIDLLHRSELDADQRHMTATIRESTFALLRVIGDILDISKIEAGKLEVESIAMSVNEVLEGVAHMLAPNAARSDLKFQLMLDPDIPAKIMGDPVRLRQILFNLAGNAIKFTAGERDGGGSVTLGARRKAAADGDGEVLVLQVSDNGIGIEPARLEVLFKPFTQADVSTTRRFGGTGLGLSISRNLAHLMGGDITATSAAGEGSIFTVRLPLDAAAGDGNSAAPGLAGVRARLAVDDRALDDVIRPYLRHAGGELEEGDGPTDAVVVTDDVARWRGTEGPALFLGEDTGTEGAPARHLALAAYPLIPSQFLHKLAVAAGREVPAIEDEAASLPGAGRMPTIDEAVAAGELILIAEDNPINQDVIRRQLNMLSYAAEVVSDGQEALDALGTGRYGLLLADCQMPVLDGYELAKLIRQSEAGSSLRLPIVAITASAMEGEAEKCIAAGMDDYLAKPLEMDQLTAALARWLPKAPVPEAGDTGREIVREPAPPGVRVAEAPGAAVDSRAIQKVFGEDPKVFREILGDFLTPARAIVAEIDAAYSARDAAALGAASHKLKSSAKMIGAWQLAALCESLEQAGGALDWRALDAAAPELAGVFAAVEAYIEAL